MPDPTRVLRGSRIGGTVALVLGGRWCALMGDAALDALAERAAPGKFLMLALFAGPACSRGSTASASSTTRVETVIDDRHVPVARTGLLGRKYWREPTSAYQGVLKRTRLEMPAEGSWQAVSTNEFSLKLAHAGRGREILLYEVSSRLPVAPDAHQRLLKRYAALLRLPMLEE